MRKCRFCAKEIPIAARVCPHCHRDLIPGRVTAAAEDGESARVPTFVRASVIDIDMPFGAMVNFMVKWTLASIPALFVVTLIVGFIAFTIAFLFGGLIQALVRLLR